MEELKKSSSCGEMELRRMRYLHQVFREFDYADPQEGVEGVSICELFLSENTEDIVSSSD